MSKSKFQKEYEEYQKYKEWQEVLCCKNAQEVIDFVMSNYLTEDEKCKTIAEQSQRIAELEEQLKGCIRPKFKKGQMVYSSLDLQDIYKGQIDVFDYYAQKYWVFFGDDIGCEWCCESELFKTKEEAQAKLKELQGENNVKD